MYTIYMYYTGKFSNGTNFRIIRKKKSSCAKIKTGLKRLALCGCMCMPRKLLNNRILKKIFQSKIFNLCKSVHQRKPYEQIYIYVNTVNIIMNVHVHV